MKRGWAFLALCLIILIILAVPRLFVVPRVARELEAELAAALGTDHIEITLHAPWGWELLLGRIPRLTLSAQDAVLEGMAAAQVEVQGEEILFQPWTLFQRGELVLTGYSGFAGSLVITENALNEVFWREVDPSRQLWLEVSPTGLAVRGKVGIWNTEVEISVVSDVLVKPPAELRFVVKEITLQEARIPPLLLEMVKDSYNFTVDLGEFPLPVEIQAVELLVHEIKIRVGGTQ